jgi:probable F420-dependent oxidoreductase
MEDPGRDHQSPSNFVAVNVANQLSTGRVQDGAVWTLGLPLPMNVDGGIGFDPSGVIESARLAERVGYDGIWSAETSHDPFLPLVLAAEHTERIELGTGIAVAFARNPMNLAVMANDLQTLSKGRFMLGLGSQIKPHIEKRFSMPWSHPAPRMRELILAIRAIWASWSDGGPLAFRGEFYRHTLMTPMFNPGPNPFGNPKIFLAAVGERMTEVAGEVADGMLAHGFTTERYLREVTVPALERGLAASGRVRADVQISYPGMVVTGSDESGFEKATKAVKTQLAFYGSTPAYRPVLELHGWGDLQTDLNTLSKRGAWDEMANLIDDEMLRTFAVVGELDDIAAQVLGRFADVIDRFNFYAPYAMEPERWAEVLSGFR